MTLALTGNRSASRSVFHLIDLVLNPKDPCCMILHRLFPALALSRCYQPASAQGFLRARSHPEPRKHALHCPKPTRARAAALDPT